MISLDDRGLLLGDGLFETILAVDGVFDHLPAHLDRMAAGCVTLGLPVLDFTRARRVAEAALSQYPHGRIAVRLTLTAGSGGRGLDRPEQPGPVLFATASPSAKPVGPARLMVSSLHRNAGSPTCRIKSLSYLENVLARREAKLVGADEALLLNHRGEIASASASNVFWLSHNILKTPALSCGVLAGIARGRVLDRARELGLATQEVCEPQEALDQAGLIFLTNSLIGVRQAYIGHCGDHPLIATLAKTFPG